MENLLFILWRHLQYYLIHCKPVDPDISLGVPGMDRSGLRRLQGRREKEGGGGREKERILGGKLIEG